MNVAGPIRSRPLPLSGDGRESSTSAGSSNDVNMYLDVPSFELSLDEFEEYALARLKVSVTSVLLIIGVPCIDSCLTDYAVWQG